MSKMSLSLVIRPGSSTVPVYSSSVNGNPSQAQLHHTMSDGELCQRFGKLIKESGGTYGELIDLVYSDASDGRHGMKELLDGIPPQVRDLRIRDRGSYQTFILAFETSSTVHNRFERSIELMNAMGVTEEERVLIVESLIEKFLQHTLKEVHRFGVESQPARIDLANFAFSKTCWASIESFKNFGITDPSERITFLKISAQKDGETTAKCIQNFEIEEQAVLVETLKSCVQNCLQSPKKLQEIFKSVHKFGIKDQEALDGVVRFWVDSSPSCTWSLLAQIPLFRIRDKSHLINLFKYCAKHDGLGNAEGIEGSVEQVLLQILNFYARGGQSVLPEQATKTALETIKNISCSFGGRISDPDLIEIVKVCAQCNPKITRFYINQLGIEDQAVIDELTVLCQDPSRHSLVKQANLVDQGLAPHKSGDVIEGGPGDLL